MTQIKQEPCDYVPENHEQVATCIEVKDPLDIKLEPVLDQDEESKPTLHIIAELKHTSDVDLDRIELLTSEDEDDKDESLEENNGLSDDEKDQDYQVPDEEDHEIPNDDDSDVSEDIDVEGVDPLEDLSDEEEEMKTIEIEGLKIVQKGQYSKCPRCEKFIKSTFIIRHIKLHDAKEDKVTCPDGCELTFAKINNMFRHLKNVHKSKEPFVCKHCGKRFAKSKTLTGHLAKHRAEKRRAQESEEEALENSGNGRFVCEFPGTVSRFTHFLSQ